MDASDLVAVWDVPLHDGLHRVEFEHGTTTGKRVIRVDEKEILRRDWLFKLVGRELFNVGKAKCAVNIEAFGTFTYQYTLEVNGKNFQKFSEQQSRIMQTWIDTINAEPTRICLEKDTLDVWVNGRKVNTTGEFVDDGTETHFEIGERVCCIKAYSSGKKNRGMLHKLIVDGKEISPCDPKSA